MTDTGPPATTSQVLAELSRGLDAALSLQWDQVTYVTISQRIRQAGRDSAEQVCRISIAEDESPSNNLAVALALELAADTVEPSEATKWWNTLEPAGQRGLVTRIVQDVLEDQARGLYPDETVSFVVQVYGAKSQRLHSTSARLTGAPAPAAIATAPSVALSPARHSPPAQLAVPPAAATPAGLGWIQELLGALEDTEDPAQRILITVSLVMTQQRHEMQEEWATLFHMSRDQFVELQRLSRELLGSMSADHRASRTHAKSMQAQMLEAEQAKLARARQDLERVRLERRIQDAHDSDGTSTANAVVDTEVKREAIHKFGGLLEQGLQALVMSQGIAPELAQLPPEALKAIGGVMGDARVVGALQSPGLQAMLNDPEGREFFVNTLQQLGAVQPEGPASPT